VTDAGPGARVLVVTHDEDVRVLARRLLRNVGYEVAVATDPSEAVARLEAELPALVLLDVGLPRRGAWAVLARLRALPGPPAVVVLVPRADYRSFAQAIREGVSASVFRPFHPDDLVATCQAALAHGVPPSVAHERRQDTRRLVVAEVSVVSTEGAPLGPGELADLAVGGAQVRLPVRLPPATRVRLTLPVPVGSALTLDAVVQWNGRAAFGFRHGLQFVDLTLASRRQLSELLDPASA
jgi:CheY-like chemotaxis protein